MEKRNNIRVQFHVRSIIKYNDLNIEGDVDNLSTGGMLVNAAGNVPINEPLNISILLYGSSSHLSLSIIGKAVRISEKGIAIKFTELDLDSFIHLRNIVSRNAFDEEKIIKEFQEFSSGDTFED